MQPKERVLAMALSPSEADCHGDGGRDTSVQPYRDSDPNDAAASGCWLPHPRSLERRAYRDGGAAVQIPGGERFRHGRVASQLQIRTPQTS